MGKLFSDSTCSRVQTHLLHEPTPYTQVNNVNVVNFKERFTMQRVHRLPSLVELHGSE